MKPKGRQRGKGRPRKTSGRRFSDTKIPFHAVADRKTKTDAKKVAERWRRDNNRHARIVPYKGKWTVFVSSVGRQRKVK